MPVARPSQSSGRNRTKSWWDVLPVIPRWRSLVSCVERLAIEEDVSYEETKEEEAN